MSDTIFTLEQIVKLCAERESIKDEDISDYAERIENVLGKIVTTAGDCLEDHDKGRKRGGVRVRKARVYQTIVARIAAFFGDAELAETPEGFSHVYDGVRAILADFKITTVDYQGKKVKIK